MKTHTHRLLITAVLSAAAILTFCPAAGGAAALRPISPDASFLWRMFTCHLVHWSAEHLFYDGICFAIIVAMLSVRKTLVCMVLSSVTIAIAITLTYPEMTAYGGLSGINCALFTLWAFQLAEQSKTIGVMALGAIITKTLLEIHIGHTFFVTDTFISADMAHVAGIVTGVICGICRKHFLKMIDIAINYSKFSKRLISASSFSRSSRVFFP
ncbi:MAG: rhombosortase [Victivallales bacterium]|nr:rhombosortase [Victivallales bacterium]